jgi:hypothetical protein
MSYRFYIRYTLKAIDIAQHIINTVTENLVFAWTSFFKAQYFTLHFQKVRFGVLLLLYTILCHSRPPQVGVERRILGVKRIYRCL